MSAEVKDSSGSSLDEKHDIEAAHITHPDGQVIIG